MISHRSGPKNAGALKKQINLSRKYWDKCSQDPSIMVLKSVFGQLYRDKISVDGEHLKAGQDTQPFNEIK